MSGISDVLVVGLTGKSGSGKTTCCQVFIENGFQVINCDQLSREVTAGGTECLKEIAESFPDILLDNGELDRKRLGSIVFGDRDKLELLGALTYPHILGLILERINGLVQLGHRLILLDAPTLFESRADDFCDLIIAVLADDEIRMKRISSRDGMSEEEARKRLASQYDDNFYRERSDFTIKNNKDLQTLRDKVREVSEKIKEYHFATKIC